MTRAPSVQRRHRRGSALVLAAVLAQWLLLVLSTAHHAGAAAAELPLAEGSLVRTDAGDVHGYSGGSLTCVMGRPRRRRHISGRP